MATPERKHGPGAPASASGQAAIAETGWTPIVRLRKLADRIEASVCLKVEAFNPGGSSKDRIAAKMIEEAERTGLLKPGGTVIEATAGNTGLGLALVACVRGYRCIFVMPDKMSDDKVRLLRAYGAEVVITPANVPPDSPESYNGVADRLAREIVGAWRANQFGNMANPQAHYEQTGPEIWEQTQGRLTAFVAAAGTGGTISGVGLYLKEKNPEIRVIGADIEGSILSGGAPGPWKVEGIGEDFVPRTLNSQVIDEWIRVSDAESFFTARRLAREEGLLLGGSSGTALAAALRYARRCTAQDLIVAFCPDTGRNYLTKMYDDGWLAQNGLIEQPPGHVTVGDALAALGRDGKLIYLEPDDTLEHAADLFGAENISQAPVVEAGQMVGAVHEITIMHALHQNVLPRAVRLREVMARPLPKIDATVSIEESYRLLLAGNPAVVVTNERRLSGIITRSDLMRFYEQAGHAG
jgi:cystathionine beta-synthase